MADENGFAVSSSATSSWSLYPVATFPRLRALLWSDSLLYASRGYDLLRAEIGAKPIEWKHVASLQTAVVAECLFVVTAYIPPFS